MRCGRNTPTCPDLFSHPVWKSRVHREMAMVGHGNAFERGPKLRSQVWGKGHEMCLGRADAQPTPWVPNLGVS